MQSTQNVQDMAPSSICSSLDPFDLHILTPHHLQGQFRLTVRYDGLESSFDLVIGLVILNPDRLATIGTEDGHENAHELDLTHLHAGARPWTGRPGQEGAPRWRLNVRYRRRVVAGAGGWVDQPSRRPEGGCIRSPCSCVQSKRDGVDVDGCAAREKIRLPALGRRDRHVTFLVRLSRKMG